MLGLCKTAKKLTLVNCIWTLPVADQLSEKNRNKYTKAEETEFAEFIEFRAIMQPVCEMFKKPGVDFDIKCYTFKDFLGLFKKTDSELGYLRRYTFD